MLLFLATNDGTKYALTINNKQKLIDLFFNYINASLTTTNALKFSQSRIKVESLFKKYFDKDNPDAKLKVNSNDAETDLKEFLKFYR
ncbi:hypothetical protein DFR65_1077 [Oceanihabitans sediminis]|uniref:hypothetical protein n=1 Tax=Oceanihabitans sediminis TaxID=1812012 RepID=UPI000E084064|nr:hypothetical protein [Oceanihabitans sediminis]RBP28391.1 hypothetical protein DFR65_1077 [Oceanihabitans sediminis]